MPAIFFSELFMTINYLFSGFGFFITFCVVYLLLKNSNPHNQFLFNRKQSPEELKVKMIQCLNLASDVLEKHDIPYWLDQGTLLGTFRNKGFIPWDRDVDIAISNESHDYLWSLRSEFPKPFKLIQLSRLWSFDKIMPFLRFLIPRKTFLRVVDFNSGAFVDILEYKPDGNETMELLPWTMTNFKPDETTRTERLALRTHTRDQIFPLTEKLQFEGRNYYVPAKTKEYLHQVYGEDLSPDHVWDDIKKQYTKKNQK